jgi:hypothetical protein
MGNLISKSAFNDCFKHWKCFLLIFLVVWNLNFLHRIHRHFWIKLIPKLGDKTALGTNVSFNDSIRANKSDVANSQKCSYLLARNATCAVSFEWHLWRITLTSFHQNKTCFSFGQEVASPSLSMVSHKRNLLISISLEWHPVCCTFFKHLSEQCPFSVSLPTSQQLIWCSCQCW